MNTQSKTAIIGTSLGAIVLVGLIWFAEPSPGKENLAAAGSGGTSTLTTDELTYDFGAISMTAGTVRHTYTVTNRGTTSATIKKMYTSCMCTTATITMGDTKFGPIGMPGHTAIPAINAALDAGATASVEAVFDPAAHGPAGIGTIERIVRLELENGEPLELRFRAFVTP